MRSMHTISSVIQLIAALTAAVALLSRSTAAQEVDRLQTGRKDNVAPFMIVAQFDTLIKMDINGSNTQILLTAEGEITAVDFHYRRGLIFYLVGDLAVGLYSYNLFSEDTTGQGGQGRTNLMNTGTERPTGLAVDWINDKVYWIDNKKRTLEVYDIYSGENQMLFRFSTEQPPQGLTILPYPNSGWLFVTARTGIYQFSLNDSSQETTIHKDRCGTKITINRISQKLYWLDTCVNSIEESQLDEDCKETAAEVVGDLGLSGGIAEYDNDCYYTQKGKIYQKSLDGSPAKLYDAGGSMITLSGLAIVHPSIQPEDQLEPLRNQKNGECPTIGAPVSTGTTTILPATTLSPTTEPETVSPTTEELTVSFTTTESTTASPTTEALTTPSPTTDIPTTKVSTTPTATTHSTTTADEATSSPLPTTHSTTTTDETTTVSSSVSPISTTEVMTTVTSSESPTESKEHFTTTEKQSTTDSEVKPPLSENPVDGLNRMREEPPSSMVLIVISVCVVLVLLILVASATYLFLVVFKYHRRRRGSYNVRERRRGDESCAPLARSSFRAFTDYHPSVSTRVNKNSHASTLTGSSSVDSFERMSIGSPLVVPCSYQVTEAEVQPAEQVVFAEVTEGEIQPVAAARPEIVQVGSSSSVPTECDKKGPYGCGTLYASEERQMYFSL